MIQIPNNPYQRPVDSVSPRRSGSDAPVQQATAAVQRAKAARDRRHRYERRNRGQGKNVLMDRRLGADRRGRSRIDISI
jgi:hypothetical protein